MQEIAYDNLNRWSIWGLWRNIKERERGRGRGRFTWRDVEHWNLSFLKAAMWCWFPALWTESSEGFWPRDKIKLYNFFFISMHWVRTIANLPTCFLLVLLNTNMPSLSSHLSSPRPNVDVNQQQAPHIVERFFCTNLSSCLALLPSWIGLFTANMAMLVFLGSTADIPRRKKAFESTFKRVLFSRLLQEAQNSFQGLQHLGTTREREIISECFS